MKLKPTLGSPAWIERVFASPDARKVWGRARPTQRYAIAGSDGEPTYAEGGNEAVSRALMILGVNTGQIKRWKFQPFELTKAEFGIQAFPDLLFQTHDNRVFVAEMKSARYLNHEKLEKVKAVESIVNGTGRMRYLLWTDAWPLVPATTRLVRELRRCGTSAIPKLAVTTLQKILQSGPKTFLELRELGYFRDVVMAAVWHGKAHLNLSESVTDTSVVTANVSTRRFEETLCAPVSSQTLWHRMERVQNPVHRQLA